MALVDMVKDGVEYAAVQRFYGTRTAVRSGVPLMNHINDGLKILSAIGATSAAMAGFCLHPLFQNDNELLTVGSDYLSWMRDPRPVMLTMEYRRIANLYLAHCVMPSNGIELSPVKEVNDMLIADKVQNRKDFIRHHKGTHQNSARLDQYFSEWLSALGVDENEYNDLIQIL